MKKMKPLPPFEEWPYNWQVHGWNGCLTHAVAALEYLTNNEKPTGGEQYFNAIDLDSTAYDMKRTIASMMEYHKRIKG